MFRQRFKSQCFGNGSIDLYETWHDDAIWPSESYWRITYPVFTNPRCSCRHFEQELSSSWDRWPFGHNTHGPKRGKCCVPFVGGLGPHVTQCGLGRGLFPYQVASWSIQPFGHSTWAEHWGLLYPLLQWRNYVRQLPQGAKRQGGTLSQRIIFFALQLHFERQKEVKIGNKTTKAVVGVSQWQMHAVRPL